MRSKVSIIFRIEEKKICWQGRMANMKRGNKHNVRTPPHQGVDKKQNRLLLKNLHKVVSENCIKNPVHVKERDKPHAET